MKVKEFLDQIEKYELMIAHKEERKKKWQEKATNRTSQLGSERVQSSGSKDKIATSIIEVVELDKEIESIKESLKAIERTIEQTSKQSYKVLYQVYFEKMSMFEIAEKNGKSYSWATTAHRKAKKELQNILEGEKENG